MQGLREAAVKNAECLVSSCSVQTFLEMQRKLGSLCHFPRIQSLCRSLPWWLAAGAQGSGVTRAGGDAPGR